MRVRVRASIGAELEEGTLHHKSAVVDCEPFTQLRMAVQLGMQLGRQLRHSISALEIGKRAVDHPAQLLNRP